MSLWTEDEVADLDRSWDDFSNRHPARSYKAWWNKRASQRGVAPMVQRPQEDTTEAYFDKLLEAADLKPRDRQVEVTSSLSSNNDKRPIGIAFTGDWHVGQQGTDHRLLREHNRLLANQDGLYIIGMGDYMHNAKAGSRPGNALYDSIFPDPGDQLKFIRIEMDKLKSKIIGLVRGCHEDWDRQLAGRDILQSLCDDLEAHNLWHGGIVNIEVGTQTYHLGVRHKFLGESKVNSTNAQRSFYDVYPETAHLDVVALGHLHYCDMQKRTRRGKPTVYLRSGSYHVWDEYGQKLGGYKAESGVPVVIFYPNKHKIVPFSGDDLEDALSYLRYIRGIRNT